MAKRILPFLLLSLFFSNYSLSSTEISTNFKVKQVFKSENFIKDLSKKYPKTLKFLKMHEVSSTLSNKLNELFTPEAQEAILKDDKKYLIKAGFRPYDDKSFILAHKSFKEYIIKFPSLNIKEVEEDIIVNRNLLNGSRVWLADWLRMVQNDFIIPKKQIFFLKSNFTQLSIVVVDQKVNFDSCEEKLTKKQDKTLADLSEFIKISDMHNCNVRNNMIIDTEAREMLDLFVEDPFSIYKDPLNKNIKAKL